MAISDDEVLEAVAEFWRSRETGTQSARHDKAFLNLIARELNELGWPAHVSGYFADPDSIVGGYFRVAKSWDIVCRDTLDQPRICIEFKSQVGSYGNNENNRYEEALGSGLDLRVHSYAQNKRIALGFIYVMCDEPQSRAVTRARLPDLDPAFANTSHVDRRMVFAERIVSYQLNGGAFYDAAAVLLVRRDGSIEHPANPELSLLTFVDKLVLAAGDRE